MTSEIVEELAYIAKLLEQLPERICDEMEQRDALKKKEHIKEIQTHLEYYATNINEINKMMYGCQNYKMDDNNAGIQSLEDLKRGIGQDEPTETITLGQDSGSS